MARRKSWNTLEMSYDELAAILKVNDTVMIPMGSLEKHGAHCPLGTDSMTTMGVVRVASELAETPYTPLIPVGYSPHHMGEVGQGPSPVGLMSVQLCKALGAGKVILTGTRDERLGLGKKLGADHVVNMRRENRLKKSRTLRTDWS